MSTVFGSLDATDEAHRRVPSAGWGPAVTAVLRELSRDLASGKWDPIGDDLALRARPLPEGPATFAYPPDTTPTAIELMSREEDY